MDAPSIRYARTADSLNIAYEVLGGEAPDLIVIPGVTSNIEVFWENPRWSSFMRRLGTFSRLILFDRRGVGLSDRPAGANGSARFSSTTASGGASSGRTSRFRSRRPSSAP